MGRYGSGLWEVMREGMGKKKSYKIIKIKYNQIKDLRIKLD